MGLNNRKSGIYLSIGDGKINQSYGVTEDTPGAIKKIRKDGSIAYVLQYDSVSGFLTDIKVIEQEFSGAKVKKWEFTIQDGDETYLLQVGYSSRYAKSILFALPNVDFSKGIEFSPWMKIVDDKKKTAVYLNQEGLNGESVRWFFTRDEPNGMPEMKQVEFKGQLVWDDHDQCQFLERYVEEHIKPKLQGVQPEYTAMPAPDSPEDLKSDLGDSPEDSDLPF